METFAAVSDEIPSDPSFLQYDVNGHVVKSDGRLDDIEVLAASEYKHPF